MRYMPKDSRKQNMSFALHPSCLNVENIQRFNTGNFTMDSNEDYLVLVANHESYGIDGSGCEVYPYHRMCNGTIEWGFNPNPKRKDSGVDLQTTAAKCVYASFASAPMTKEIIFAKIERS